MPALPSVNRVVRIALKHSWDEDTDVVTRFFMQYGSGATTNALLDTWAHQISLDWATHIAPTASSGLVLQNVTIEDLTSATSPTGSDSTPQAGHLADPSLPADAAVIIRYKINRRYRGGHPRGYWPLGVVTSLQTAQSWTTAAQSGFLSAVDGFFGAITADAPGGLGGFNHANVSYYEGFTNVLYPSGRYHVRPTPRTVPLVDLVDHYEINPHVGSQRRRTLQSA